MTKDYVIVDNSDFIRAARAMEQNEFRDDLAKVAAAAIRKLGGTVRDHVKAALQRHRRTGRLQDNVLLGFSGFGMDFQSIVASTGPIAHLIAGGVKPHPVTAHAMPIGKTSGGIVAFRDAAMHPGFKGDPYFDRGIREARGDMDRIVDRAAQELVDQLAENIKRGR